MKKTTAILASAATAMSLTTSATAQDTTITNEFKQTSQDLVGACTTFSTPETKTKCISQIAIETHQLYISYMFGMLGKVSHFQYGLLSQELAESCDNNLRKNSKSIQSPNIETSTNAMNNYVGECLAQQINAQTGEFTGLFGDFKIGMSTVPFDGNRLELIDAFRMVALGVTFPEHNLVSGNNALLFQKYKNFTKPAFTK